MTHIYFVRHAEPVHSWKDDRTRPLTQEGVEDSKRVSELFRAIPVDVFISSPYVRSMDTIKESAKHYNADIITDEGLRERQAGESGNTFELIRKRWFDFDFCEQGGESLASVQTRNISSLAHIVSEYQDQTIVIGTHGTALSTILNYYDSSFHCDFFFRILDFMPYVIRLDFNGSSFVKTEEILALHKDYKG